MKRASWRDAAVLVVVLAAVWYALTLTSAGVALATPSATFERLAALLATPSFWLDVQATFVAFLYALAISIVVGIGLGLWLGLSRFWGEVGEPILVSFYSLPKITLYPLVLLLFGLGLPARVAFGAIHGVIPIVLFTMNAIRNLDPVYYKSAKAMRLSRAELIRGIVLPGAAPEVFSGIRVGFSLTLLGVLIGEMFASQHGLGFVIMSSIELNDVSRMLAVTVFLAILAVAANVGLLALDRRLHRAGS
jgi:NitT/TauT family transport system permease protein